MKCYISVVCVLSAFVAVTLAAPTTLEDTGIVPVHNQVKRQADNSEVLNRVITYSNQKLQQLRILCPQLFQVIDAVIQNVTSQVFRVVGGALLRSGGLGGGGSSGGSSGGGGGRVSVVLPTFPPDEDEDDDDDDDKEAEADVDLRNRSGDSSSSGTAVSATSSSTSSSAIALSVDLFTSTENNEIGDDEDRLKASSSSTTLTTVTSSTEPSTTASSTTASSTTTLSSTMVTSTTESESTTTLSTAAAPFTSPSLTQDSIAKRHIRIARDVDDQETSASGGNGPDPASDLSNVDADDADRNKRFLPFGVDAQASGGSGNFLFDLIRNTADRAARTVGTVYRMVAGTENLGFGITATSTSSKTVATAPASQLVAGSGATEESDEKSAGIGGVAELDIAPKATEGIPGPITRLLVIANRGIANLIQDLILRLAQTSERIVNFKARLVTALI